MAFNLYTVLVGLQKSFFAVGKLCSVDSRLRKQKTSQIGKDAWKLLWRAFAEIRRIISLFAIAVPDVCDGSWHGLYSGEMFRGFVTVRACLGFLAAPVIPQPKCDLQ